MDNNELALAFAREVMGQSNARINDNDDGYVKIGSLYVGNVAQTLEAVQRWCDKHNYQIEISYIQGCWSISIFNGAHCNEWETDDFSEGLMTSCLEAERKRRGDE